MRISDWSSDVCSSDLFLQDELAPRAQAIEDRRDWDAVKAAVRALGSAGYLRLMFADLYRGPLERPGLTHATILSEEAAYLNYAFETTIATALSCAYPLHRPAPPASADDAPAAFSAAGRGFRTALFHEIGSAHV